MGMSIDEIRSISLVDYLSARGHTPVRHYRDRYWYLSPLHDEKVASFKVDMNVNMWYDFGLKTGGNIINLAQRFHPDTDTHHILLMLEESFKNGSLSMTSSLPSGGESSTTDDFLSGTVIQRVTQLGNRHLCSYLQSRHIPLAIARQYCREVYYTNAANRNYYGIGFPNLADGWEIRNRYYKRSIGVKQISFLPFRPGEQAADCCLFEGFFDFLSYVTLQGLPDPSLRMAGPADCLVLNSVTMLPKALPLLERYPRIHCFLDNDEAGRRAIDFLKRQYPDVAQDESFRYAGFKDLNEYLCR